MSAAPPRKRRPRNSLTPELILDAAEALADEQGSEGLSMRGVAGRLEATPMALYNHFETKEQLVDGLLDRVLARFEAPAETGDWVTDLGGLARAHRRLLDAHPWGVAQLATRAGGPVEARAISIAERGGFPRGPAAAVAHGVLALNHGWRTGVDGDYQLVLGALLRGLRG